MIQETERLPFWSAEIRKLIGGNRTTAHCDDSFNGHLDVGQAGSTTIVHLAATRHTVIHRPEIITNREHYLKVVA
jgi:hypothetical protein